MAMISVELHAGLRPAVARAHRRALLSLPMSFRVVDRGGDVLVAERGVAVDAVRIVRVGPREGLIAGEVADSPVWWDPVVARLAGALAPYADDLLAVAASAVVDGRARGEHVEPVAAELAELIGRLVPGGSVRWLRTLRPGVAVLTGIGGRVSRAVTVTRCRAPAPPASVAIAGVNLSVGLRLQGGGIARPSRFEMRAGEVTLVDDSGHTSAHREMWKAIAAAPDAMFDARP